jgi:xanthine dehydrogenase accessory factor
VAWKAGLACGGSVRVFVETIRGDEKASLLHRLAADVESRRPVALILDLASGDWELAHSREALAQDLAAPLDDAFRCDRSAAVAAGKGDIFINVFNPAIRLVIVGAVHIAQQLVATAQALDYDVKIVDPREAFATAERFDVEISRDYPDEALPRLGLDGRTAVIALTHDPKIDDPALISALASDAFYVGALGSRKTHARRVERLLAAGVDPAAIERIHAPIGLNIGAQGAAEIALSIIAEIVAVHRGKAGAGVTANPPRVATIVLAGGRSSRMAPRNKLLESFAGEPMIVNVVRAAVESGAHTVIVVTGHEARRIAEALRSFEVTLVHNPHFADGMSTSLKAGVAVVPKDHEGALIMLGDMPQVLSADLQALLVAFVAANDRSAICVPVRAGRRGNPVLWGAAHFPEIMRITGDAGAKQLLVRRAKNIIEVPAESDGVLADIDVPADLQPPK